MSEITVYIGKLPEADIVKIEFSTFTLSASVVSIDI